MTNEKAEIIRLIRLPMSLTPRLSGRVAARAHHSPATPAFLHRLAPFFATDQVVGGPLLVATIVALICTNSAFAHAYEAFWDKDLAISLGALRTEHPLADWVNDALLPLFFLIIGAEVKREFTKGALSTVRTAAFPLAGAIGGIVVPIAVYLAFTYGTEAAYGWGTVITSDTAFALAIIGLFATRLPTSVRAVLLAFAAIDDVGGLLVIAVAYTDALDLTALIVAIVAYAAMFGALKLRLVSPIPYVLLGLIVWGGTYVSGIHATIAGVMLGLLSPTRSRLSEHRFADRVQEPIDRFQAAVQDARQAGDGEADAEEAERMTQKQLGYLQEMTQATDEPAERLVQMLNPWVSYVVLPLFALSAVRIHLSSDLLVDAASSVLGLGVFAGLAIGKPMGFLVATWLAVTLRLAELPEGVSWRMVLGIGALSGIGFTISLFIANLAFPDVQRTEMASLAVLIASVVSAGFGYVALRWASGAADGQSDHV